jgi:hypothetical protein
MCKREVGELINQTLVFVLFGLTLTVDLRPGHRPSEGHTTPPSLLEFAIPTLAPTVGLANTNPRWQEREEPPLEPQRPPPGGGGPSATLIAHTLQRLKMKWRTTQCKISLWLWRCNNHSS